MIAELAPVLVSATLMGTIGWVTTTWLKVKNGYPLEYRKGKPLYPMQKQEVEERIGLLSQENARLYAELGAVKDRLATIERIVTDDAVHVNREIERLRYRSE